MITNKKINMRYIFFIICFYLFVFQSFLQNYISIFKYFDEFLALLVIPIMVVKILKNRGVIKIQRDNLKLIVLLIIIFSIGIYANEKYKYQSITVALSDALLVFKFFLAFFLSQVLYNDEFINKNRKKIFFHIKIVVYILLALTALNYAFKLFPADYRFGIMTNRLFYSHSTALAAVSVFLLSLVTLCSNRVNVKYTIILLFLLVTTLRFKAIGAAMVSFLVIIYVGKIHKKVSLFKFLALGIFCIIIASSQIENYFIKTSESARNQLLIKSFEIAKDYFPIGSGFGTYASYLSGKEYSDMYYLYGLNMVYGISKDNTAFVSDTFWPMVIGQFGVIGTVCYVICLGIIFKNVQKDFKKENKQIYTSKIICLIYLLIASTSESAFVHPMSIPLAIIIGINTVKKHNINENIENGNENI